MKWIKSGGGPLICVDGIWARCWRGIGASSKPGPNVSGHTDYERACATKDYVVGLETNGGHALILGDMPLETSVWVNQTTTIVRLFYAEPQTDFGDILEKIGDEAFHDPIESTEYRVTSGRLVVFDAALDGRGRTPDWLAFALDRGTYRVLTALAKPDTKTSLLLHRFSRVN